MIRLLVDSSSDYTMKDLQAKNIHYVPLTITLNEKSYKDGLELKADDFYEMLMSGKDFPKTSQPSPQDFLEIFKEAKEKGDDVICILLSSSLSGTCQSAHLAKDMVNYDKIHIVDSLTATIMIKVLADYAYELVQQNVSAAEITEKLNILKSKVKVVAALDTLEYLYRGGRLSRASATIGELANLKPVIHVTEDGNVGVVGKCIGRNKALMFLMKTLASKTLNKDFPIYTVYAYGTENCEKLEERLTAEGYTLSGREQIGSTIGAHVGPGAFGVIYVEK
ncbi:MAG: DegV family protein [Lachnospiraceae bacterium]|nr:DegV family protein [Lachnospiraceae bacterium]